MPRAHHKSSEVMVRKPAAPNLFAERAAMEKRLKELDWKFIARPTMALADEMTACHEAICVINRRIVKTLVFSEMMALELESNLDNEGADDSADHV